MAELENPVVPPEVENEESVQTSEEQNHPEGIGELEEHEPGVPDHPADRLIDCIEEIQEQIKRLSSRRSGDLKFELMNNVYPTMINAFSAVVDFIDNTEKSEDAPEPEEDRQIREAIEASTMTAVDKCRKLVKISESAPDIIDMLPDEMKEDFKGIVDWAKQCVSDQASQDKE